ncbi:MAG: AI-2E family transporter [Hyphomicrobiales bacterium]|nr:MAG: AI-2E family transporter [Hyphomicrobiales bacterium]
MSLIAIGIVVLGVVLEYAQVLLAPLALAVVIGLMFGPLADRIERLGIPPWASGLATVSVFLAIILVAATGFAVPLSAWLEKLPIIWSRLQSEVTDWRSFFTSIAGLQEQLREAMGQSAKVAVAVDGGSPVEDVAYLAPAILGQIVLFLAGLYFFVATRHRIRIAVLSLFFSRRLRWRIAHVFRDAEQLVSTYLFHITALNIGLGLVVSLALWLAGVPSALLWGMLAGVLNYVIYIGPAMMVVLLLGVGLASATTPFGILTPPLIFLLLNFIEAQFVTPLVLGRTMTLNPFVIFLAIVFWIWIWGPVGGFIAVPSLLVLYALIRNTFPARS